LLLNIFSKEAMYGSSRGSAARRLISVTAILVAIGVFDTYLYAAARPLVAIAAAVPAVPIPICSLTIAVAVHVAISTGLTIALHPPVTPDLPVIAPCIITAVPVVAVPRTHPPVAPDLAIVTFALISALLILLRGSVLAGLCRSRLRRSALSFLLFLGE
jgi:hypothetical protein